MKLERLEKSCRVEVLTVDEGRSISESTELMMNKNSSAVVVTQEQRPKGIFTERDLLKRVINKVPDITKTPVREVMTAPVISMPQNHSHRRCFGGDVPSGHSQYAS